uniref:Uncharacterized protein n=1 Tax=Strombidinopsis acuminata TaxID=141414 RepID=A0A7S3X4G5_9SPIT
MGAYTGPTGAASAEDVAQAIIDLEGLYSSKAKDLADTIVNISPASDDSIAALDIPADLAAVMKKRDGGHYVFDYKLYSTSEIATKKDGDILPVGENIDGDMIGLKDGAVVTMNEASDVLAPSFGIFIQRFRDAVLSNKVEWAEVGWVSIQS